MISDKPVNYIFCALVPFIFKLHLLAPLPVWKITSQHKASELINLANLNDPPKMVHRSTNTVTILHFIRLSAIMQEKAALLLLLLPIVPDRKSVV